jgi:hypothetical protein
MNPAEMSMTDIVQMAIIFGAVLLAGALGYMLGRREGGVTVTDSSEVLTQEVTRLRRRAVAKDEEIGRLRTEADRQRRRARRG